MEKYLAFRTQAQRRLEGTGLATFIGSPLAAVGDVSLTHGTIGFWNDGYRSDLELKECVCMKVIFWI